MADAKDGNVRGARAENSTPGDRRPHVGAERRSSECGTWGVGPTPEDNFEPFFRTEHQPERRASAGVAPRTRTDDGE